MVNPDQIGMRHKSRIPIAAMTENVLGHGSECSAACMDA